MPTISESQPTYIVLPSSDSLYQRILLRKESKGIKPKTSTQYYADIGMFKKANKTKELSLIQQKSNYLKDISTNDLLKMHRFIPSDVKYSDSNGMYDLYYEKEWDNGICVVFNKNNIKNTARSVWEDTVSLELFKESINLCYVMANAFAGAEIQQNGYYTIIRSDISIISIYFDVYSYKLINKNEGLLSLIWDEHTIYYKEELVPNIVNVVKYHDLFGESNCISYSMSIDRSADGLISDINRTLLYCRNEVTRQYNELRQRYSISTRRPNIHSKRHQQRLMGSYISHRIPFSTEIECYGKDKETVAQVSYKIHKDIGLSGDGSLNSGLGYPIEIQTPILSGKRGEICIANLCDLLVETGFKVDKTCGLHIHLDGKRLNLREKNITSLKDRPTALINLYLAYRLYEKVILSFLPSTRRNNRYCADFTQTSEYHGETIRFDSIEDSFQLMKRVQNLKQFELYWYKVSSYDNVVRAKMARYTPSRYYGVNFHSLLKDNHLEIRYHSGTLNYEKILFWTDFHGKIVEKCADGTITFSMLREILKEDLSIEALTDNLFSILDLNKDTVEYLLDRQLKFKDAKASEEILIDKTKKLGVV